MGGPGKGFYKILTAALLMWPLLSGSVALAENHLSGTVGADLGVYNFSNIIYKPLVEFEVDRRLSNQFLELSANGAVVNNHFASYLARARFQGTQVKAGTATETTYEYLNPTITSYFGSFSLFADRPYPLKFYTGKSEVNRVRYEPANRSETELVDQGLAVIRRYESINESTGVQAKYAVDQDLNLDFEAQKTNNKMTRRYDFDENRNIWVEFWETSYGEGPFYNIEVINKIVGHDVLLFARGSFVDTIPAEGQVTVVLEEGLQEVVFAPVGLNRFSGSVDIGTNMDWIIHFNDPPGSKDLDQENKIVTGKLNYEGEGPFKTEANFEINSGTEAVQRMTTDLKMFNNLASYDINPNTTINMLTNFSSNMTDVKDISHQLSNMFMNQTTGRWSRQRGMRASLTHSFFRLSSETGASEVSSTNNIVNGLLNVPTGWNRHETDILLSSNILSDSKGFKNSMYTSEVRNQLEWKNLGFKWRPKHMVKYSKSKKENPDGSSNEWENKFLVDGENSQLGPLGSLKVKGEYNWRRRMNIKGMDSSKKYVADVGLSRKFADGYRLKLGMGWEKEAFDKETNDVPGEEIQIPKRLNEIRQTFRIDLQTRPAFWVDLGGNAMWISTNESDITKYSGSLSVKIPRLNIPIKSYLIKERRVMERVRPQELLRIETKSSYNFRKIRLVLAHMYTDEYLDTEHYTYSEFSVKIYRDFDIY